jgi:hypothetical protein
MAVRADRSSVSDHDDSATTRVAFDILGIASPDPGFDLTVVVRK